MYNKIKFDQMDYCKESGKSDPKLSAVLAVCSACKRHLSEVSDLMKEGVFPV